MKKTSSAKVAFTTKDGKAVQFKPAGTKAAKTKMHVKQLEKRLSAMEQAVMKYNNVVQQREVQKQKKELQVDAVEKPKKVAVKSQKPQKE